MKKIILFIILILFIFTGCSSELKINNEYNNIDEPNILEKLNTELNKKTKVEQFKLFLYGDALNCKYPKEEVGSICCIKSEKHTSMCVEEYNIFEKKIYESEEISELNKSYYINNLSIQLPGGYLIIRDTYFGGALRKYLLYFRDDERSYQIHITYNKNRYNFTLEEFSDFFYEDLKKYNGLSNISTLKYINENSSYFDYDLSGGYKKRQGLVLKDNYIYYITYSGSDNEFIEELNLILKSFY